MVTPSNGQSGTGGHTPQSGTGTAGGNGPTPRPASDSRPYDQPGGVDGPSRDDQDHLENSIPRDENGNPVRHPDPNDGNWTRDINGRDPNAPGRNNNCVDVALSTVDTYSGNPTAAAHRTPDHDGDGNSSDRGESGGRDRIENTLGARFSDMGNGRDAYNRLEDTLRQSGHGSQAVIITTDSNGRAHAWNAVNHNGQVTYVDAQTGRTSDRPLHNGDNGVFAIPLDPDRRPTTPAPSNDRTSGNGSPTSTTSTPARRPEPQAVGTDRRPASDPAGSGTMSDNDSDYGEPMDVDSDADPMDVDSDSHHGNENPLPPAEKPDTEHSNLPPDHSQADLRDPGDDTNPPRNPVHRIDLDNVHENLRDWADNGQLREVLQIAADRQADARTARENGTPVPTAFTRNELETILGDDFRNMNDGERGAVVASIARLSQAFHETQGVGGSPEADRDNRPYKNSPAQRSGDPDPATKYDRSVAAASRDGSSTKWKTAFRQDSDVKKDLSELHRRVTGNKKASPSQKDIDAIINAAGPHRPDFSGKNYAVIEVVDSNGESKYVVESSVPADATGVSPRHSEKHLLDWVDRVNSGKQDGEKYTIANLYTEREPCGVGQGHADCSKRLRTHPSMDGAPVHYSTTYREDSDGVSERDKVRAKLKERQREALEKMGNLTEAQQKEELKKLKLTDAQIKSEVGKRKTQEERAMEAEMDAHLAVVAETWAKVQRGMIPDAKAAGV